MKCPNCQHISGAALQKCSNCGHVYERSQLEAIDRLDFLIGWLEEHTGYALHELSRAAQAELQAARQAAIPAPAPAMARSLKSISNELALVRRTRQATQGWVQNHILTPASADRLRNFLDAETTRLQAELGGRQVEYARPPDLNVLEYVIEKQTQWEQNQVIPSAPILRDYLIKERDALLRPSAPAKATPQPIPSLPNHQPTAMAKPAVTAAAAARPAPALAPKPVSPPINWGEVWERTWSLVASGALLRGLLYLGAFMIVVSAIVLVVVYWSLFPTFLQITFVLALPLSFYAGGFILRTWLKIPVAGGVFTGIGALLIAVDFVAVYQLGGLSTVVDENLYWLIASIACVIIYTLTALRVRSEFFGHITIAATSSAVAAFTQLLRLPLEWGIAAVSASAAATVGGAAQIKQPRWGDLVRAGRRLPQLLMLIAIGFVIYGKVMPASAAAFAFACIGFGLLAWYFPHRVYAYVAVVCSLAAIGYTMRSIDFAPEWYASVMAVTSLLYLLAGRGIEKSSVASIVRGSFRNAFFASGLGLVTIAIIAGFISLAINLWAGVVALTLAAGVLILCAYLFRRSAFVLIGAALFVAPLTFAVARWLVDFGFEQRGAWLMATWSGLGLLYIGAAVLARTAKKYVRWLHLLAHPLAAFSIFGLAINYMLTFRSWSAEPTLAATAGIIFIYLASAIIHDQGRDPALSEWIEWLPPAIHRAIFLTPLAFLLPVWMSIEWWASMLERVWLGAALAALGLAYVLVGQLLAKRHVEYRLRFHAFSYALLIAGMLAALSSQAALLASSLISVMVLGLLARIYRRNVEIALAAILFILPFQLALNLMEVIPHAQSLAYILVASAAYLPVGILLDRCGRKFALPVHLVGYTLSAYAILSSLFGRLGLLRPNLEWVGAVAPLIASGMYVFSVQRFRRSAYAWASALAVAIMYNQALVLLSVAGDYHAAAWVVLAIAYMVAERVIARAKASDWLRIFIRPLGDGSRLLCMLGWVLTAPETFAAIFFAQTSNIVPFIIAQLLAVLFLAQAAYLYRRRLPLMIEPWLAFIPTTIFFISFGRAIFGQPLQTSQYALVWAGLGALHLLVGTVLDRARVRYSHGLYAGGYVLCVLALIWSASSLATNIYTLGALILIALLSHALVHFNRHQTFDDLLAWLWRARQTVGRRAARTVFLFFAAYAFPFWLNQLLVYNQVSLAWRGAALALAAPIYIAMGLGARRLKPEYTWSLYSAGYALTAIGAMITFDNEYLALYVLALDAVVYAVSAYIFRRSLWLYLSTVLVPVIALIALHYYQNLYAQPVASLFILIAFVYFGIGRAFDRKQADAHRLSRFAPPLYFPAFLLSAVAVAVSSAERILAIEIFSAGMVLYAISAWTFRDTLFIYPAAWLAAVPYYLTVTLVPSVREWHGLVWLPFVVAYILQGKFVLSRTPWAARPMGAMLLHRATPFYFLAYALSVEIMAGSLVNAQIATMAFAAGAAVYFGSAALFRRYAWLFPGLLAAHLGFASFLAIFPSDKPPYYASIPFMGFTWLIALVGYAFSRFGSAPAMRGRVLHLGRGALRFENLRALDVLLTPSWARPMFFFAALDVVFWQSMALNGAETAIVVASGYALLLALFTMLWQDRSLAYGALFISMIALLVQLREMGLTLSNQFAIVAGVGFGLYWVGRAIEITRRQMVQVWVQPLSRTAVFLTALGVVVTLVSVFTQATSAAAALGFAGALYLAMAYRGRMHRLGYLGVALLQIAWVLTLVVRDVRQPQFYAIPAGLYFTGIGFLERRRGSRLFAQLIETFGLAVLLLTSFIQSLSLTEGFPYFVLLLVEGLLVIWWGAARRLKIPFFIGLGASALNVIAQVIVLVNVYDVNRFLVIFAAGILLVMVAVVVERQRALIIAKAHEWREALEKWE